MEILNDMALFVEVGKVLSFRKAALTLDMPSSTLSRRISHLEHEIGLRLLHRTTRKVELTEAGQIYFERCKRIVREAQLAHEQLGNMLEQPNGVIRASVPVDFATIYIAPLLADFAELYPGINFEIDLTPRQADLITENIDVAIRIGQPKDSSLIARKIAQFTARLFAAPRYLTKKSPIQHPAELYQYDCIGFPKVDSWTLTNGKEQIEAVCSGRFQLNNVGMMKRLAVLGQGVILIPESAIEEEIASGKLIPILPDWRANPQPVYAFTETRLLPAKVRIFIDYLQSNLN